jgi:acyl-CoA synthetase (AMP-forming)/AMP-acid ligase II
LRRFPGFRRVFSNNEVWAFALRGLINFGEALAAQARLAPHKIGASDLDREMTFALWDERARRLANALLGLGLAKGDRVALLACNCVEWVEIYAATSIWGAKRSLIVTGRGAREAGP